MGHISFIHSSIDGQLNCCSMSWLFQQCDNEHGDTCLTCTFHFLLINIQYFRTQHLPWILTSFCTREYCAGQNRDLKVIVPSPGQSMEVCPHTEPASRPVFAMLVSQTAQRQRDPKLEDIPVQMKNKRNSP